MMSQRGLWHLHRQPPAFSFVSISLSIKWEWASWYLGALLVPTS